MGLIPWCKIWGEHQYVDVSMMNDHGVYEVTVKCFRCGERTIVFADHEDAVTFFAAVSRLITRWHTEHYDEIMDFIREHDKP